MKIFIIHGYKNNKYNEIKRKFQILFENNKNNFKKTNYKFKIQPILFLLPKIS